MEKQLNIPQLRFPGFEEEWRRNKFGEIYNFISTNSLSRDNLNYVEGEVKNIHYGDIHTKFSSIFISEEENVPYINSDIDLSKYEEKCFCKEGDLIIADASEDYADIGKAIEIKSVNKEKIIAGLHTIHARPEENNLAVGFSGFMMKNFNVRKQIMTVSQGLKVLGLSSKKLAEIDISVPTIPEQTRIASFFTSIDDKLSQLKKKKTLLEQYKKGIMQKIFSQQIRFKDDTDNDFPEWDEKRLGEFARITTGSSNREDSILDGEFTFFDRSQDIRSSNRFLFDAEAIIVPGEGQEFIPKYFIGKFDLHQRTYAIMDFKDQDGKFLYYSISYNSNHLISHAVGSTVKSLRLPMFEKMPILLPCLLEQTKIANFLSSLDSKIAYTQTQIEKTETWKKGLLQQMFV